MQLWDRLDKQSATQGVLYKAHIYNNGDFTENGTMHGWFKDGIANSCGVQRLWSLVSPTRQIWTPRKNKKLCGYKTCCIKYSEYILQLHVYGNEMEVKCNINGT